MILDFRNGGVYVRHAIIGVPDTNVCTCCRFGLEVEMGKLTVVRWELGDVLRRHDKSHRDPTSRQQLTFRRSSSEKKLGKDGPFTSLDDVLLDHGHGSAIEKLVRKSSSVYMTGSVHVFNRSITSRVDRLSRSCCLPPIPRSRAWQAPAQAIPSWT